MKKSFAIIDIGTNAVKCKIYTGSGYLSLKNKMLLNSSADKLDEKEVVEHVADYVGIATQHNVQKERVFICATEAFRKTINKEHIKESILQQTGRNVHIISPKREAYLSVIGGLSEIPAHKDKNKDLIAQAKNVLYIESGGGSTEVSLVNTRSQPPVVISTVSIPCGSKKYIPNKSLLSGKIKKFLQQISRENYLIDGSLLCVVNANAISRIIAKQYSKKEPFDAYATMAKQQRMSVKNLQWKIISLLRNTDKNSQETIANYELPEDRLTGFRNHCRIISGIFRELHQREFFPKTDGVPVITTTGGLKEGLGQEIIRSDLRDSSQLEETLLKVYEMPAVSTTNDEIAKSPEDMQQKIKNLKDKINGAHNWISNYEDFYKNRKEKYDVCRNKSLLIVKDTANQKLQYTQKNKVAVSSNKNNLSNNLYEDMLINAKKSGQTAINFDENVTLDIKLRIYAAALKCGLQINNFKYNDALLENAADETKKIVQAAHCYKGRKHMFQKKKQSKSDSANISL